jgi:hypothetical protein
VRFARWGRLTAVLSLLSTPIAVTLGSSVAAASSAKVTWSIVATPDTSPATDNMLRGVTCVSTSSCWAIGFGGSADGDISQTLAMFWNGTTWSIAPTPDTSPTEPNQLSGIACLSGDDCWAVGWAVPGYHRYIRNLAEHWDGTAWSIVPTPDTNRKINELNAVTCVSESDCWAVGIAGRDAHQQQHSGEVLIEHWNGSVWSMVRDFGVSGPGVVANELNAVACSDTTDCWAVGTAFGAQEQTLTAHWNGHRWRFVASPDTSTSQVNQLTGIACAGATDCWAVGSGGNASSGEEQTLAENWDGNAWSIVTTPDTSPDLSNRLLGVTCVDTGECWSVGDSTPASDSGAQTLAEQWSGTGWSIDPTENEASSAVDSLDGTECTGPSSCWAVGWFSSPTTGSAQTLVERGED